MEPPFGLDQSLLSTDDRLNGTLLSGWRTKKTVAGAHLSKSLQHFRSKTDRLTGRANCFSLQRVKMGMASKICACFAPDIIMEPPFKESCIHHWPVIEALKSVVCDSQCYDLYGCMIIRNFILASSDLYALILNSWGCGQVVHWIEKHMVVPCLYAW